MKKIIFLFSLLFFGIPFLFPIPTRILAQNNNCKIVYIKDDKGEDAERNIYKNAQYIKWSIEVNNKGAKYTIYTDGGWEFNRDYKITGQQPVGGKLNGTIPKENTRAFLEGPHNITLELEGVPDSQKLYCLLEKAYTSITPPATSNLIASCDLTISSNPDPDQKQFTPSSVIFAWGKAYPKNYEKPFLQFSGGNNIRLKNLTTGEVKDLIASYVDNKEPVIDEFTKELSFISSLYYLDEGEYEVSTNRLWLGNYTGSLITGQIPLICSAKFKIDKSGGGIIIPTPTPSPEPSPTNPDYCKDPRGCGNDCSSAPNCSSCNNCRPTPAPTLRVRPTIQIPNLKPLCEQLHPNFQDDCKKCVNSPKDNPPGRGGIWSAIGCLPTDFSALVNKYVFTTGVGLAGGIAFLYFLYGAFMILTSSGNAEKMEEAKQIITSSLAGLILIIFSVFLLQVIGVQVLKLPGFG